MMSLQLVSDDLDLLNDAAKFLLLERLIANAIVSDKHIYTSVSGNELIAKKVYLMKGISKSLLFGSINDKLRDRYDQRTPLVYSEPIILIDPSQTEELLEKLAKV